MRLRFQRTVILYVLALTSFSYGVSQPASLSERTAASLSERVLSAALSMLGRPYKYRGETPAGFDCSGLVRYSYRAAGVDVPRATGGLRKATYSVEYHEIRKGDLVFFDRNGKRYGHVGIYAGGGRFIHAPSRGKHVRIDNLRDAFWRRRFNGARRFVESTPPVPPETEGRGMN